jgi:hypothetical protein
MLSINSEIIAGFALLGMGLIFVLAAFLNPVWALVIVADFVIIALGAATIGLGIWTAVNEKNNPVHTEHH